MLLKSDRPILEVIKALSEHGIEAGYLVPTETGMVKSILDAHASLRDYLKNHNLHDYDLQSQGPKKYIRTFVIETYGVIETKSSLYRPETKSGDPRIWIYDLKKYASPYNLLAVVEFEGDLYVINTSNEKLFSQRSDPTSYLGKFLNKVGNKLDDTAEELMYKLREIAKLGFVNSLRTGSTGVGMTLETMLGIKANANRAPDFKGIEIKASRLGANGKSGSSRVNLFSQVPDWNVSNLKSGGQILDKYGYRKDGEGRLQLYCTVNHKPNPQGLFLKIDEESSLLNNLHKNGELVEPVVSWQLENLRKQLESKHPQTFWVKANKRVNDSVEQFHYVRLERTQSPLVANLSPLIETGDITFDYTLSRIPNKSGKGERTRDHGYLFKIKPDNLGLLFPPSKVYDLI